VAFLSLEQPNLHKVLVIPRYHVAAMESQHDKPICKLE
jgi:hypothetical protein